MPIFLSVADFGSGVRSTITTVDPSPTADDESEEDFRCVHVEFLSSFVTACFGIGLSGAYIRASPGGSKGRVPSRVICGRLAEQCPPRIMMVVDVTIKTTCGELRALSPQLMLLVAQCSTKLSLLSGGNGDHVPS